MSVIPSKADKRVTITTQAGVTTQGTKTGNDLITTLSKWDWMTGFLVMILGHN